jgi:beta-xylosidase
MSKSNESAKTQTSTAGNGSYASSDKSECHQKPQRVNHHRKIGHHKNTDTDAKSITFTVACANTVPGDSIYVVGSTAALGSWNVANALPLTTNEHTFPHWQSEVPMTGVADNAAFEFKFLKKYSNGQWQWESIASNRCGMFEGRAATLDCGAFV